MPRFPSLIRTLLLTALFTSAAAAVSADIVLTGGGRPANVNVPPGHVAGTPAPVVLLLHGYTMTGAQMEAWVSYSTISDSEGFLLIYPDGTADCVGDRFWNATDACCNFCGSTVDDSAYLAGLIDELETQFAIDSRRVFVVGYSNGGFMAYRLACDHADRFAVAASIAGATWQDESLCSPSEPLHTLQIHGTADATILYAGGDILGVPHPGAVETVETWATYNGCSLTPDTSAPPLDLIGNIAGDETNVARYETGCVEGGSAELWTMVGAPHVPTLAPGFAQEVTDFLFAHPKPEPAGVPSLTGAGGAIAVVAFAAVGGCALRRRGPSPERKPRIV
jgi:polyhydroxybutyrate depolymerase